MCLHLPFGRLSVSWVLRFEDRIGSCILTLFPYSVEPDMEHRD